MKKKWLSVLLSFIFPGLGQIYLGKILRGITFIALNISLNILGILFFPLLSLFTFFVWIAGMIDSSRQTNKINAVHTQNEYN
ncbi:sugar ABC transporter permease [Bacillus sp. MYb56]|uniref:sugar ABC transporter permease n=1 Tax=Bacillus sp. MYb56 TaxID=1827287 RepID=UPI000CFDFDC6|nr:sugar ABC transporter permease [Bacillus sp. MYb56]PRD05637.1 sugar ABC transporter permease [Bacillus sp. MYb56]